MNKLYLTLHFKNLIVDKFQSLCGQTVKSLLYENDEVLYNLFDAKYTWCHTNEGWLFWYHKQLIWTLIYVYYIPDREAIKYLDDLLRFHVIKDEKKLKLMKKVDNLREIGREIINKYGEKFAISL